MVQLNVPDKAQVIKALDILKKFDDKKEVKFLNENERIVLQFSQKFVPLKGEHMIHIVLPNNHSEIADDEICLFVKDNDKYNREYEATIQLYKDLLSKHNIHSKIDIVPMKKLKLEYNDYEAKRRLSNSYEMFLADARIFRLLPAILGKHFIGRKRFLTKIDFGVKDLKKELDKCLKTVHICLTGHGPTSQCTVGHIEMSNKKLAENIVEAINQISSHVQYGFRNIRSINIKTNSSASVPLYISLDNIDASESTDQVAPGLELEDEVSTVINGKIRITKDGRVVIISNNQKIDVANAFELPVPKKHGKRNRKRVAVAGLTTANKSKIKDKNVLFKNKGKVALGKSKDKNVLVKSKNKDELGKSKDKNVFVKSKDNVLNAAKNKMIRAPPNKAEGGNKNDIQNVDDASTKVHTVGIKVKRKAVGPKKMVKKLKIDIETNVDDKNLNSVKSCLKLEAKTESVILPNKKKTVKRTEIKNAKILRTESRNKLKK